MKLSRHFTNLLVISLFSIGVVATALTNSDFSFAVKAKHLLTNSSSSVIKALTPDNNKNYPPSLAKILNADGRLNLSSGHTGSFDANGYWMSYGAGGATATQTFTLPVNSTPQVCAGFASVQELSSASVGSSAQFGDLNGDNRNDLVSLQTNKLLIFLADQTGKLNATEYTLEGSGVSVNVLGVTGSPTDQLVDQRKDLNGDGKPDLIVRQTVNGVARTSFFVNRGDGTFATPQNIDGTFVQTALVDLNTDNRLDWIALSTNKATVYLADQAGRLGNGTDYAFDGTAFSIFFGTTDIDKDGKIDFQVRYGGGGQMKMNVYRNQGGGTFTLTQTLTLIPDSSLSYGSGNPGDFNGDGFTDFAITAYQTITSDRFSPPRSVRDFRRAYVFINNTNGTFTSAYTFFLFSAGSFNLEPAFGDIDADGKMEVVTGVQNVNTASLTSYVGNRSAANAFTFSTKQTDLTIFTFVTNHLSGFPAISIFNFFDDSDPYGDLYYRPGDAPNGREYFGYPDGTLQRERPPTTTRTTTPGPDLNGDNIPDRIQQTREGTGPIVLTIELGNANGTFRQVYSGNVPFFQTYRYFDFNGDGQRDLSWSNGNEYNIILSKADSTYVATTFDLGANVSFVRELEFNGDNRMDLWVQRNSPESYSVLINDCITAPPTNTPPTITAAAALTRQQGSPAGNAVTIATVNDAETPVGNLTVTATTIPTGLTVTNITNTNGTITANVATAANATVGNNTVVLTVTDGGGLTATANLIVNVTPASNTTTGANVAVTSNNTTVTFSNVTTAGNTTITPISPAAAGSLPNGYVLANGSLAFEITTTALFSGPITITFNVPGVTDATVFSTLRVLHGEGSPQALVDRTVLAPDTPAPSFATRQISARVTSLSPFVIASLVSTPPTGCTVTNLQQPVSYATADTPSAVAHGDFNGDGKPDLVTANYEANAVSVLLNNGNGGFNPAVNYNAGGNPKAVAVGDLNGDGKLDLVVANLTSFDLSIFLGNGDGTFTTAPRVTGMSYPTGVAIGDFNNDGKADLVVANSGSFLATVVYGNGDGTFTFGFEHFNGDGGMPYAVTAGDFNKDGKTDFAVAFNTKDAIGVYLNLPSGLTNNIQMFPAGAQPIAIAAGDFNGDGTDDVAVANYGSSNVTVVTGLSTVTTIAVGSLPESLAVADLNGDAKKDLIVGNAGTNFVSLLTATSGGQFTRQDALGVESPSAVAATDFNGDGQVDVVVADYWVNRITTYRGSCESTSSLEAAGALKTLRSVPSKYDGYPNVRSGNGRRGNTTRPRSQ